MKPLVDHSALINPPVVEANVTQSGSVGKPPWSDHPATLQQVCPIPGVAGPLVGETVVAIPAVDFVNL